MEVIIARLVQILAALGGAYLFALWFATIVWTFQDIQGRSRSVITQIFSTLVVVLFPFAGLLLYLILRPRDTLDDSFQRSLEEEYLLQDLEELPLCYNCQRYVDEEFVFCPHCRAELRQDCAGCGRLIDLRWDICPYCATEQYPEEPVITEVDDWDRLPAGHEHLEERGGSIRGRLAGRRGRDASDYSGRSEMTAPMHGGADEDTAAWDAPTGDADEHWAAGDNGASAYPSRWDETAEDDSHESGTEELPIDQVRRQR